MAIKTKKQTNKECEWDTVRAVRRRWGNAGRRAIQFWVTQAQRLTEMISRSQPHARARGCITEYSRDPGRCSPRKETQRGGRERERERVWCVFLSWETLKPTFALKPDNNSTLRHARARLPFRFSFFSLYGVYVKWRRTCERTPTEVLLRSSGCCIHFTD